jgi:hypothetical protein
MTHKVWTEGEDKRSMYYSLPNSVPVILRVSLQLSGSGRGHMPCPN